jgi:hypothetical protein
MEFDNEKIRFLVESCRRNNMTATDTLQFIHTAWGESSVSRATVFRLFSEFGTKKRASFDDADRCGRPKTVRPLENITAIRTMLEEDPSVSIEELANCSSLSHGTVSRIRHEDLQVRSVLAKWVPYKLSDVQKEARVACAADMLSFYHRNRASFSRRLIIIDEKWVYYRAIGTKASNRCWLGEDDPKLQVPRRIQHEKKSMIILAACFDGKFYLDVVPHGQNVDGDYYVEFLKKMRHSFHRRSTGSVDWHEMVIQHDNARPHTKASVSAFLDCCGV